MASSPTVVPSDLVANKVKSKTARQLFLMKDRSMVSPTKGHHLAVPAGTTNQPRRLSHDLGSKAPSPDSSDNRPRRRSHDVSAESTGSLDQPLIPRRRSISPGSDGLERRPRRPSVSQGGSDSNESLTVEKSPKPFAFSSGTTRPSLPPPFILTVGGVPLNFPTNTADAHAPSDVPPSPPLGGLKLASRTSGTLIPAPPSPVPSWHAKEPPVPEATLASSGSKKDD